MSKKLRIVLFVFLLIVLLGGAYAGYTYLTQYYNADTSKDGSSETEKIAAPDFTVYDSAGNAVKFSDFAGQPVVLNFWASWCGPCQSEMPHFDSVYAETKDEVVFLIVNLTDGQRETKEDAEAFITEEGYSFPIYFDSDMNAADTYGISSIPTTVFIGKDGYIVTGYKGAIDEDTLLEAIELIR